MEVSIKELLNSTIILDSIEAQHDSCAKCGQPITVITGRNPGREGDICDDCYFET